jgi:CheY-like chemotaxis protein
MACTETLRVLLVDDEDDFRENLARLLRHRGFQVVTAGDGTEAVGLVDRALAFDVAVLDVRMPGMDGIATLQALRRETPELEVIMLTGHACVEDGMAAIRLGAFDYLQKPCDLDDLLQKLDSAARAEAMRRRPVLWPRHTAAEMTFCALRRLGPEALLTEALNFFDLDRSPQAADTLFVTAADGSLCGMVTRRDLIAAAQAIHPEISVSWQDLRRNPQWLPEGCVRTLVRNGPSVLRAAPEEPLADLARRMIAHHIRSMPVVDDGRVTGIVRLRDVLQFIDPQSVSDPDLSGRQPI